LGGADLRFLMPSARH